MWRVRRWMWIMGLGCEGEVGLGGKGGRRGVDEVGWWGGFGGDGRRHGLQCWVDELSFLRNGRWSERVGG
jgi:hypothetical protein